MLEKSREIRGLQFDTITHSFINFLAYKGQSEKRRSSFSLFYLKKASTFHPSILGEEYMQWDFVIEIPYRLLIIFHSNLQEWAWRTSRHILKQNHRQQNCRWCPRLQLRNLINNCLSITCSTRKFTSWINKDQHYLQRSSSCKTERILVKLDHESIQGNLWVVLKQ